MSDAEVTADNSEKFTTSPYQNIPSIRVFKIAQKLSIQLKQESVAVFIPTKEAAVGDTSVSLTSHSYSINETIKIIRGKMPEQYQAFSLHIKPCSCTNIESAVVDSVEWLGSRVQAEEIGKFFPLEKISSRYGRAFLIYADGRKERL